MKLQITIPESLSEITLGQYQKFAKLDILENKDTSFLMHKMIEIFCNLKLENIARIKYSDAAEIVQHINKLFEHKQSLIPTFELQDIEFGIIPKLDDMTLGEYIDLDENLTDWDNIHRAMSVLYRPITFKKGERYNIEEYEGAINAESLKQMPLDVVMGAMVFFYNLENELAGITLNYLDHQAQTTLTTQQQDSLEENGAGFKASINWLKEMLPTLGRSLD